MLEVWRSKLLEQHKKAIEMYKMSYYRTDHINSNPKQEIIYHSMCYFFQNKLTNSSGVLSRH